MQVKNAFSLIELMIVIVIIGVVYTLAITNMKPQKVAKEQLSFVNLKEYLQSFSKDHERVTMRCSDECSKCAVYANDTKVEDIKSFFDASVELYKYDFFQGPIRINQDECFSLSVDGEGVSDQVLVVYKEKAYDFTPYFEKTKEYDSLGALIDAKEKTIRALQ